MVAELSIQSLLCAHIPRATPHQPRVVLSPTMKRAHSAYACPVRWRTTASSHLAGARPRRTELAVSPLRKPYMVVWIDIPHQPRQALSLPLYLPDVGRVSLADEMDPCRVLGWCAVRRSRPLLLSSTFLAMPHFPDSPSSPLGGMPTTSICPVDASKVRYLTVRQWPVLGCLTCYTFGLRFFPATLFGLASAQLTSWQLALHLERGLL